MFYLKSDGKYAGALYAPSEGSGVKIVSFFGAIICSTDWRILKLFKAFFHGKLEN